MIPANLLPICLLTAICVSSFVGTPFDLNASIVSISTTSATGTEDRDSPTDFVGVIDGVSPFTIGGLGVNFSQIPGGQSVAVGDVAGRDLDGTTGGRSWTYELLLPANAVPGTGLQDIFFSGDVFESSGNNLEGNDQLTWTLFVNGTSVDSFTPGAGVDFTSASFTLSDPGGAAVTSAQVVLDIDGFNAGAEWFVTSGLLAANYNAVPEPAFLCFLLAGSVSFLIVRKHS